MTPEQHLDHVWELSEVKTQVSNIASDVTTLKWYAGFAGWSKDKWLDVIAPVVAVCIIGGLATVW